MIRINLLGTPKPKKGKRASAAANVSLPSDGPPILVVALVVLAFTVGGNYFWYYRLNKTQQQTQQKLQAAKVRIAQLSQVQTAYMEKQKQHELLKRRFDVIDQLRANQAGPATLLSTVSDTVNHSEAVWLNTMRDEGNAITLEGVALSNVSLANLMLNLRKTGQFKTVEVKETFQDDVVKDMQAFTFTLVCEKQKA